jgi:hypothetical protein
LKAFDNFRPTLLSKQLEACQTSLATLISKHLGVWKELFALSFKQKQLGMVAKLYLRKAKFGMVLGRNLSCLSSVLTKLWKAFGD